jgi:hypothetical protein
MDTWLIGRIELVVMPCVAVAQVPVHHVNGLVVERTIVSVALSSEPVLAICESAC